MKLRKDVSIENFVYDKITREIRYNLKNIPRILDVFDSLQAPQLLIILGVAERKLGPPRDYSG